MNACLCELWGWRLCNVSTPPLPAATTKSNLKLFPLLRVCWERKGEFVCVCVCLYWGVGGGGLEWEKGGEGVGGEDKRALSALLILYFSSGGCEAFPASCSVGCLHSLRETDRCHANTHTLTLADCHFPSRPHTTHICRQLYVCIHTNTHTHKQKGTVALSYKYSAVFFCRTYPKLTHTGAQAPKVTLGCHCTLRQTAYYHTLRRKFQRQNKTKAVVKKQEEGRWRDGRVWNKAQEQKK